MRRGVVPAARPADPDREQPPVGRRGREPAGGRHRRGGAPAAPARARAPEPRAPRGRSPGGAGAPRCRHRQAGPPAVRRHHPLRQRDGPVCGAPGRGAPRVGRESGPPAEAAPPGSRPGGRHGGARPRGGPVRGPGGELRRRTPLPRIPALQRQRLAAGRLAGGLALDPSGDGVRLPAPDGRAGDAECSGIPIPGPVRSGSGA